MRLVTNLSSDIMFVVRLVKAVWYNCGKSPYVLYTSLLDGYPKSRDYILVPSYLIVTCEQLEMNLPSNSRPESHYG